MSLINKMLADLESRVSDVKSQPAAKPVLAGLHSVKDDAAKKKLLRLGVLSVVLVGSLAVGASRLWPLLIPLAPTLFVTQTAGDEPAIGDESPLAAVGAIGHDEGDSAIEDGALGAEMADDMAQIQSAAADAPIVEAHTPEAQDALALDPVEVAAAPEMAEPIAVEQVTIPPETVTADVAPAVPPPSVVGAPLPVISDLPPMPTASAALAEDAESTTMTAGSAAEPPSAMKVTPDQSVPPTVVAESESSAPAATTPEPALPMADVALVDKKSVAKPTATKAKPVGLPKASPKAAPQTSNNTDANPAAPSAPKDQLETAGAETAHDKGADEPVKADEPLVLAAVAPVDHGAAKEAGAGVLADRAYRKGVDYLNRNRMAEGEERLRAAVEQQPEHSAARLALAGLLMSQQRILEAQSVLEDGERAGGFNDQLAQALSRIYVDMGLEEKALRLLEQHKAKGVENPDFMATLAVLYQRQGRFNESASAYRVALAKRPAEGRWWLGLGLALESTQQWHAASMAYAQAVNSSSLPTTLLAYAEKRLAEVRIKAR